MIPSQNRSMKLCDAPIGHMHQVDEDLTETSLEGVIGLQSLSLTRDDSVRSISSTISTSVHSSLKVKTHRESLQSTITKRTSSSLKEDQSNSVCFGSVGVCYYNLVLGSHPSVSRGPPIELGWNLVDQHQFDNLDVYEARQSKPRELNDLALSPGRRELLLRQNGVKPYEIQQYEHEVLRQRMKLRMEQRVLEQQQEREEAEKKKRRNRFGLKKQRGLRNLFRPIKR